MLKIPIKIKKEANLEDGIFVSTEYKSSNDGISEKGKIMIEEALDAERNGEVIGPFSDIQKALKALKEY